MSKHCRECEAELRDGAKFCEACGAKVPEEKPVKRFCSFCGKELAPDAAFCRYCGAKTSGQPPIHSTRPLSVPNRQGQNSYSSQQTPRSQDLPDYMKPGYQQRVQPDHQQMNKAPSSVKKGGRALSFFLSIVLVAEFCVAGFKYPGFLKKEGGGFDWSGLVTGQSGEGTDSIGFSQSTSDYSQEVYDYLGITEADYEEYLKEAIEINEETSPGNPEFLNLSFTEADFSNAKTLTASVSRDNPTADFPEFGIHVDLKWWNLDNETDMLIVKQMPTKTDPSTGTQLYTYDYSLASGQSKFYTNVEITAPIQGKPENLENILTIDPDTGKWTEAYYKLSDDGKKYTFYMNHFSLETESSTQAMTLENGQKIISSYTYDDGKSIFCHLSREGATKYEDTSHYLYNVGIIKTPDFEKYIKHDQKQAAEVIQDIMTKNGGKIPASAGMTSASSAFGDATDDASFVSTMLSFFNLQEAKETNDAAGGILTLFGLIILGIRIVDQYSKGVDGVDIMKDNAWGLAGTLVGIASVFAGGPAGLAIMSVAIFIASKVWTSAEAEAQRHLLGEPRTIEEGAYHYFLTEYGLQIGYAPYNIDNKAIKKILGNDTAINAACYLAINVDIHGSNWAEYLDALYKEFKNDPVLLEAVIEASYEIFINRYWSQSEDVMDTCWRKSLESIMNSGYDYSNEDKWGTTVKEKSEELGITEKEFYRRKVIYDDIYKHDRSIDDIVADWKAGKMIRNVPLTHNLNSDEIQTYKEKAYTVVYKNTNPILYSIYTSKYQEAVTDARKKLRYEVLPWLNTRITFYWKDQNVTNGKIHENSMYYMSLYGKGPDFMFAFDCDRSSPLFLPGNETSLPFQLYLQPNKKNNILLETTIYNYIMWRCPKEVVVFKEKLGMNDPDLVHAKADFSGLRLRADPNSCLNGNGYVNLPSEKRNIKDIKVPIVLKPEGGDLLPSFFDDFSGTYGLPTYDIDSELFVYPGHLWIRADRLPGTYAFDLGYYSSTVSQIMERTVYRNCVYDSEKMILTLSDPVPDNVIHHDEEGDPVRLPQSKTVIIEVLETKDEFIAGKLTTIVYRAQVTLDYDSFECYYFGLEPANMDTNGN